MRRKLLLSFTAINFFSAAESHQCDYNFTAGIGFGWNYASFEFRPTEVDNISKTRKSDLAKHAPLANISLGYNVMWQRFLLGVDIDYSFLSLSRSGEPEALSNGSLTYINSIKSNAAFSAALKLGHHLTKDITGYVGAGIEMRKFKVQYTIAPQPENSINQSSNQTAFAAKLGFDFPIHRNVLLGIEYRKAWYQNKTFNKGQTSLDYRPGSIDTILLNLKIKFDLNKKNYK